MVLGTQLWKNRRLRMRATTLTTRKPGTLSDTNRKAKFYRLTEAGRSQLQAETSGWERLVEAVSLVLQTQAAEAAVGGP